MSYENMFPFNSRRIQALKIAEAGFNVFVFFDAQLYTKSGRCRRTLQKNK